MKVHAVHCTTFGADFHGRSAGKGPAMGPWCHTSGTTRQLYKSPSGIPVLLVSGGTKAQERVQQLNEMEWTKTDPKQELLPLMKQNE